MTARLRTAIEEYKDGHREVYHAAIEPNKEGWAWTHPDTRKAREECDACTLGILGRIREWARRKS